MPRLLLALICLAALPITACTQFPDLDNRVEPAAASADYPALIPTAPLLAAAGQTSVTQDTGTAIQARAAALRARATSMQRGIIDAPTRDRMRTGVTEPPL